MDILRDQFDAYKSQYDSAYRVYSLARKYGGPVFDRASRLAQSSVSTHPDLTSIALLLIIIYISFVFVLRAWRLTVGTLMVSVKASMFVLLGTLLLGVYNSLVKGDHDVLNGLWNGAYGGTNTIIAIVQDLMAKK